MNEALWSRGVVRVFSIQEAVRKMTKINQTR